jgi:hypothetical protein
MIIVVGNRLAITFFVTEEVRPACLSLFQQQANLPTHTGKQDKFVIQGQAFPSRHLATL